MKSKKIMQSTLALALVFGAASYICGCSCNNNVEEKSEQQKLYDLYVAYTSAKGETPQTYEEWLASIKGEKGDPGTPGAKGDQGDPGAKGEDGNSLLTGEGVPLNTLGKIGDTYLNKTNYDLYEKKTSGWELIGNIKGLDASGQGGKTITHVDAQFNSHVDGSRYIVFTFTYSDGTSDQVTLAIPREIVDIELLGADNVVNEQYIFTKLEQGAQEPKLKLHITYDDNTTMDIDLSEQMVDQKWASVNFYEENTYTLEVNFQGKRKTFSIRVVDPSNLEITSIDLIGYNGGARFLVKTTESLDGDSRHYENVYVRVTYITGKTSYVSLKQLIDNNVIQLDNFQGDCQSNNSCSATVNANNGVNIDGENTITFLTFTDYSQLQLEYISYGNNPYYSDGPSIARKVGEDLFAEDEYIGFGVNVTGKDYGSFNLYLPATSLTLKNTDGDTVFDKSQKGVGSYYVEYEGHKFEGKTINVNMYDENEMNILIIAQADNGEEPGVVYVRANQGTKENIALVVMAVANDSHVEFEITLNDLNIIDDDGLDFNNVGTYNLNYEFKGSSGILKVNVYDPDICNIQNLTLPTTLIATQNSNLATFLQTFVYGQSLSVSYYEMYHGEYSGEVEIVEEMVDASNLDLSQLGNQTITITYGLPYQQATVSITVNVRVVPDISTAQALKTYHYQTQFNGFSQKYRFDSITTYNNGIAVLKNEESPVEYVSYTLENDVLCFTLDGAKLYFKTSNEGGEDKIVNYIPEIAVKESYKIVNHIDIPPYKLDVEFIIEIYSDSDLVANNSYYALISIPAELGDSDAGNAPYYTVKITLHDNNTYTIEGLNTVFNLVEGVLTDAE